MVERSGRAALLMPLGWIVKDLLFAGEPAPEIFSLWVDMDFSAVIRKCRAALDDGVAVGL